MVGSRPVVRRGLDRTWMVSALAMLAGCGGGTEYSVTVRFDPPDLADSATAVGVFLVRACPSADALGKEPLDPLRSVEVRRGAGAEPLGPADPGRHGLHAIARNGECGVVGAGCAAVDLEEGEGRTLTVVVRAATGEGCPDGRRCVDGLCEPAELDAGEEDAGEADGSTTDGGGLDAGPDAGLDAGSDASGIDAGRDAGDDDAGLDAGPDAGCDLGNPSIVGAMEIAGIRLDVGSHAYVPSWDLGLRIVDFSDPAAPSVIGSVDTPDSAAAVAVVEPYAYVADESSGLRVVDASDPEAPTVVGFVAPGGPVPSGAALDVAVAGTLAYVAAAEGGLWIIDVTAPDAPFWVGGEADDYALRAAVSGDFAFVPNAWTALNVVDVSDPGSPDVVATLPIVSPWDLAVVGDYLLHATQEGDLHTIDVSEPAAPEIVNTLGVTADHFSVRVTGSRAYMAVASEGFAVYDVSNPVAPVELFRLDTPGDAHDVEVSGSIAILKEWPNALQVIDLGCLAP